MRTLAFRRHQESKKKQWIKKNFSRYFYNGLNKTVIGIRAHTPANCSCHMCGNQRAYWGDSLYDKRQKLRFDVEMDHAYGEEIL